LFTCVLFPLYVVASKCSWNHFISETNKTLQSFKLYFLHNIPLVPLYASASYCKGVGNIPGSHFVKAFSAPPPHSKSLQ
jgi:hypothetical protein